MTLPYICNSGGEQTGWIRYDEKKRKIRCHLSPKMAADFSYFLVHGGGIVLADGFCHLNDLHRDDPGTHGDVDAVAGLDLIAGLNHPAIDADAAVIAGFRYLSRRMVISFISQPCPAGPCWP